MKNFSFLEVKFSIYLYRRVFVMFSVDPFFEGRQTEYNFVRVISLLKEYEFSFSSVRFNIIH